ncbi:ThuA domain-containing protein [Lentisphaera profundi]|uniref:ThuA domain-containing protein n=1 Tax=Lentisphaera profundi TaxID=1658616 RepID=A0ABY7VUA4_9BACT|nr:ThuA domain-containing protein [Lentisphaera profundi]WDE97339.1 ThuA domain-containing protein [Lentisphaera profundi]
MKLLSVLFIALSFGLLAEDKKPLKIIQIAGGCCHEYKEQMKLTSEAFKKSFNCTVDTFVDGSDRTSHHAKLKEKNWSKAYDAVVFSLCAGHVKDDEFILSIVEEASKNKKGLVFLHCSLHNFRSTKIGTDAWRKLMGLTSIGHEHKGDLICENTDATHPVMKNFPPDYTFKEEEVYIITKKGANVKELARAYGKRTKKWHPVIWTSEYEQSKIFGTSIGHTTATYEDKVYTDLLCRGLLWSVGKL